MPENLGVHVQLTSDSNNFTEAMQKAYRELKEFGNETARMKAQEAALRTTIGNLEKQIASKTAQIEKARARLSELTAAGKENSKTAENLRTKIAAMEKTVEKASASIEKNRARLRENADTQSKLAAQAEAATREINQQTQAFAKNANQASSATSQLKNAFTMLKGLALGYAGKTLFNALIGSNADFEQSMTSFDVLLGSAEKAQKMMDDLTKFAAKTPLEMPDVTKATNMLLGYGVAAEDVVEVMGRLGDLAQGNAVRLDRVSLAYGQMFAKGKVTGEELRQMVEAQVPLLQGLADYLKISTAELQDMISDGKVGIDDLNGAIKAMTSEGGQFYGMMEKQAQTMSGLWSTLKDNINIFAREVGEESFGYLKDELLGLMSTIEQLEQSGELSGIAASIGKDIAGAIEFIIGFIKILWDMRKTIVTVGGAFIGFKASLAIGSVISSVIVGIDSLINGIRGIKTATDAARIANEAFKTSQLTTPWGAIAAVVLTAVGALVAFCLTMDDANAKAEEAVRVHEEVQEELQKVQNELDETAKRMDELAGKDKLTLTEQSELEKLKKSNQELNTRLILLREEEAIKAREANKEVEKRHNKDFLKAGEKSTNYGEPVTSHGVHDYADYRSMTEEEYFLRMVEKAKELNDLGEARTEIQNKELSNLREYIADAGKRYQTDVDGYTAYNDQTAQTKQHWQEMADIAARLLDPELWEKAKFDEVFNADSFRESKDALLEMAKSGEVTPETIESYEEFRGLIEKTGLTADEIANKINALAEETANSSTSASNALTNFSGDVEALQNKIGILDGVQKEYNETGDISAAMFQKMVENDLLQYLDFSSDKLKVNTDALYDQGEAAKIAAIDMLQKAAADDIHNLAIGNTKDLSPLAQSAIKDMGNAAVTAGSQAQSAASGLLTFAAAMKAAVDAGKGELSGISAEDYAAQTKAVMARYQNVANSIANIKISGGGSSKRSGGSRGGRSNAEQEAKKAAQEAEKARKERVKAYEDAINEEMRLDELWNEQQLGWGNLTEKQFTENLANRADKYRYYADELLKNTDMTEAEKLELRKKYIEKAEDLELDHHKRLMSFAADEIDNDGKAWDKKLQESEDYIDDRDFYDDWEEHDDTKTEALERYRKKVEDSYNQQRWLVNEYYGQGLMSAEDYYDKMEELHEEYQDSLKSIDREIYSEAKEQGTKLIEDTQQALEQYYELERKFKVSVEYEAYQNKIEETETELAKLERRHDAKVAEYERRVEELDAQLRAFERGQEDEEDELKRKRLQYLYDYENDDDNKRALLKQMEEVDKLMEEKVLRRELEDARLENDKMTQLYEDERKRMESFLDKKQSAYEKNIEAIDEYYEKVMSPENLMNEMYQTLLENNGLAESIGELMGEQMVEGISKKFDGWIAGAREALESGGLNLGGQRSRGFADNVINNNSKSVNLTQNITGGTDAKQVERVTTRVLNKWEMGAYN